MSDERINGLLERLAKQSADAAFGVRGAGGFLETQRVREVLQRELLPLLLAGAKLRELAEYDLADTYDAALNAAATAERTPPGVQQEAPSTEPVKKCSCQPIHSWQCDFTDSRSAQYCYPADRQPPAERTPREIIASADGRCHECAVADQLQCVRDARHEGDCVFAEWPYRQPASARTTTPEQQEWLEQNGIVAPASAKPDAPQSRSVQRRVALQKGEPMPTFAQETQREQGTCHGHAYLHEKQPMCIAWKPEQAPAPQQETVEVGEEMTIGALQLLAYQRGVEAERERNLDFAPVAKKLAEYMKAISNGAVSVHPTQIELFLERELAAATAKPDAPTK